MLYPLKQNMLWNVWQLFIYFILLPAEAMEWDSADAIGNFVYAELQSKEEKLSSLENEVVLANSMIQRLKEKIRRLEQERELLMAAGMSPGKIVTEKIIAKPRVMLK